MSASIIRHINDSARTEQVKRRCANRMMRFALIAITLIAGLREESLAQMNPSIKVKLHVLPSVNIARMDVDMQTLFAEDITHLNEMASARNDGEAPVSLDFGFSISAYENITILLSFTRPELSEKNGQRVYPMRVVCGYINDGTTYFKRAALTDSNRVQFRLRNNNLLKRSMELGDPLVVAHTFFLVSHEKGIEKNKGPLPVSTITLEYF